MTIETRKFTIEAGHHLINDWYAVPVGSMAIIERVAFEDVFGVVGAVELPDGSWMPDAARGGLRVQVSGRAVGMILLVSGIWRESDGVSDAD